MRVSHGWCKVLTSEAYYAIRKKNGTIENMMHLVCKGMSDFKWAVYNKNANLWTGKSPQMVMNMRRNAWLFDFPGGDSPIFSAQPAVLNHKIFILGFYPHRRTYRTYTMVYDTWTESLIRKAPMMSFRMKFACCVISGRIYVAGGSMIKSRATREAIVYIPESDSWQPIPAMPTSCLGAAVDGIFYVIGGCNVVEESSRKRVQHLYMSSLDSYDPETNTWRETKEDLPLLTSVRACTVMGSHIYVLCDDPYQLSFFKYHTVNDSWCRVELPFIPNWLLNFSCVTMGACIYLVQVQRSMVDQHGRSAITRVVLIYDTEMQVWSRGPDLPFEDNGAICAAVQC